MKILEMELHNEEFDVEVQYCDKYDCLRDCILPGSNNCNAHFTPGM